VRLYPKGKLIESLIAHTDDFFKDLLQPEFNSEKKSIFFKKNGLLALELPKNLPNCMGNL